MWRSPLRLSRYCIHRIGKVVGNVPDGFAFDQRAPSVAEIRVKPEPARKSQGQRAVETVLIDLLRAKPEIQNRFDNLPGLLRLCRGNQRHDSQRRETG